MRRALATLLVTALTVAACSSAATPAPTATPAASAPAGSTAPTAAPTPEPAKITIGLAQQIFSYSPIFVAQAKNFWAEENLEVEITFFKSGADNQQAVLGDAVFLGAGGYTEPIILSAQGTPTVCFGFIQAALPYQLMAKPEYPTLDALKGKVLAVSRIGSLSDQVTRIALSGAGVNPDDYSYQGAGGSPDRLAALKAGTVDGAILDSPSYLLAQDAGFATVLNVAEKLAGFPYEVLYAKKDKIEANKDIFMRFMRGFIRGAMYFRDPANESEVLDIVAKALGTTTDDAKLGYDTTAKDFPPDGAPSLEGLTIAFNGTVKYGSVPGIERVNVNNIFYPSLQEEAVASMK